MKTVTMDGDLKSDSKEVILARFKITQWNTVSIEKLIVYQLTKKLLSFYGN
jgi:hypothetical protein